MYKSGHTYKIYGDADFVQLAPVFRGDAADRFVRRILSERAAYAADTDGPNTG